jgi:hypothetical protein
LERSDCLAQTLAHAASGNRQIRLRLMWIKKRSNEAAYVEEIRLGSGGGLPCHHAGTFAVLLADHASGR